MRRSGSTTGVVSASAPLISVPGKDNRMRRVIGRSCCQAAAPSHHQPAAAWVVSAGGAGTSLSVTGTTTTVHRSQPPSADLGPPGQNTIGDNRDDETKRLIAGSVALIMKPRQPPSGSGFRAHRTRSGRRDLVSR